MTGAMFSTSRSRCLLLALACFCTAFARAQCVFPVQSAINTTIPPQSFGQGYLYSSSAPLLVPYGTGRIYVDGNYAAASVWSVLNPFNPVLYDPAHDPADPNNLAYNWTALDTRLAELKQANVNCVIYTVQDTPDWDTAQTISNATCSIAGHYGCLPPADLSPTGATPLGAHSTAFNFLGALEAHIHDPGTQYLTTHADIGILEIMNEMHSSPIMNPSTNYWSASYWDGNYDQLRRLVEDARCAWKGMGPVHVNGFNADPVACDWVPKGTGSVIIGSPSIASQLSPSRSVLCNFLYGNLGGTQSGSGICGGPPKPGSNPSGDMALNVNHGADLVDAILFHPYTLSGYSQPERVYANNMRDLIAFLQPNEKLKPLLASEWGGRTAVYSPDGQVALVPRQTLGLFAQGVSLSVTWEYDMPALGDEFTPYNGTQCTTSPGCLNQVGIAHQQVYNWLTGNTFLGCSKPASTNSSIITCDLSGASGYRAQVAWDCAVNTATTSPSGNSTISDCVSANYIATLNCASQTWSNNPQCGATAYTPPFVPSQWRDLSGNVHSVDPTMPLSIGAKPIIVEAFDAPPPSIAATLTPIEDTYVSSATPTTNYGTNTQLKVGGSGVTQAAYLMFDLHAFAGFSVNSAKLRLWVYNGATGTYSANSVADTSWTESGMSYANASATGAVLSSVTNPVAGTWAEFDVTAAVQSSLGQFVSFAITSSSIRTLQVDSREVTYMKPQLVTK